MAPPVYMGDPEAIGGGIGGRDGAAAVLRAREPPP